MSKYSIVLKLLLRNTYRKSQSTSKINKILTPLLCLCCLPMIAMSCLAVYNYAMVAKVMEVELTFLNTLITMGEVAVFVFAIPSILGYMFFSQDTETLCSLPLRRSTLFLAKLTMVYISELIVSLVTMIPMLISYGIGVGVGVVYYIYILPVALLIPVLPLLLASIFAFPIMWIVSFFRKNAAFTTIGYILGFALFMVIYMLIINSSTSSGDPEFAISQSFANFMLGLYKIIIPNQYLTLAMTGVGFVSLGDFAIAVAMLIILFVVAVAVSSVFFFRGITFQTESGDKASSHISHFEQKNIANSLLIKDFKQLIRDPAFAFQSMGGIILAPLIMFFLGSGLKGSIGFSVESFAEIGLNVSSASVEIFMSGVLLFYAGLLACGTNYTAMGAFTREGKSFYINKYLPISAETIVKTKLKFADIVTTIAVTGTVIIIMLLDFVGVLSGILLWGAMMLMGLGINKLGVDRDLRNPKLDWNNVNEAFKNNFYMAVPMFVAIGIGVLIIVASVLIAMFVSNAVVATVMFWVIVYIITMVFFLIPRVIAHYDYDKLLESIEQ